MINKLSVIISVQNLFVVINTKKKSVCFIAHRNFTPCVKFSWFVVLVFKQTCCGRRVNRHSAPRVKIIKWEALFFKASASNLDRLFLRVWMWKCGLEAISPGGI